MNRATLIIISIIVLIFSIFGGLFYKKQTLLAYSNPNSNTQVSEKLSKEIYLYKEGKLHNNTVRYQLFLLCASQVVGFHRFCQELSIQQILDYFRAVQVFSYDEVNTIIQELAETAEDNNEADSLLQQVLPAILCPYKKSPKDEVIYLSPFCCQELYKAIIKKNYKTSWGIYSPGTLFDFKSQQIKQMREFQESHSTKPKFQHSIDTSFVILENSFSKIYNQPANYETPLFFKKFTPSKPTISWEKNIHLAASKGNVKSLQYNIYLVPLLRNLIDNEGNTPAHIASKNGQAKAIDVLKEMKADFNIYNKNGSLPIHMVKTNYALEALIAAGCDINSPNKDGQTTLEIQSNPLNKDVIEGLINHGVNILLPNSKGVYWMQYVIHDKLFPVKKQTEIEFPKFVRNIISKSQHEFYKNNECLRKILDDGVYSSNIDNLRNAVNNRNIDDIITYLAMGTYPDTFISGVTNLMIVSKRGETDLVKMFANNYCDPNKVNTNGENSFWLAANNEYYNVATLLQKNYGANINIKSYSGQTLLHVSYEKGRTNLFNYLLKAGVSPNILNSKKESVQFIAFLKRDDKVAEKLQDEYNGDINSKSKDGNTLGHLCVIKNDKERLEYLIKRGLKIESKNNLGYSLFMQAIVSVDDLDISNFLLGKGAKINTQDDNGETPFFHVCKSSLFDRKKFDFLLEKNCNYNIQDHQRDFPISKLIKKQRNDEALLLLHKKANIIDPNSLTEPICVAVDIKSEKWINTLIQHGANAMNSKYPLIEKYIKLDFFDFQTMKKMAPINAAVGAPIQIAIQKGYINVAHYLWDESDENARVKISYSVDDQHRIPISTAILHNDVYLVNQLIHSNYDLSTADNIRRTPYIYACMYNQQNWMASIEQYISLENLNVVDIQGNSALTFVANYGLNNLADHLFIKGVDVRGINFDNYGIIRRYIRILDQYNDILNRIRDNRDQSEKNLNDINNKLENSKMKIDDLRRTLNFYNRMRDNGDQMYDIGKTRKTEMELRRENDNYQQLQNAKIRAEESYQSWTQSFDNINGASRETILYNIDRFDNIARNLNLHNY